jgi:hypothetical protein
MSSIIELTKDFNLMWMCFLGMVFVSWIFHEWKRSYKKREKVSIMDHLGYVQNRIDIAYHICRFITSIFLILVILAI